MKLLKNIGRYYFHNGLKICGILNVDSMECLDAISYLFDILKEVGTSSEIMDSLFAIQVISMNSEIKCSQVNYVVLEEQGCFA